MTEFHFTKQSACFSFSDTLKGEGRLFFVLHVYHNLLLYLQSVLIKVSFYKRINCTSIVWVHINSHKKSLTKTTILVDVVGEQKDSNFKNNYICNCLPLRA